MIESFRNIFAIPDLRKRVLFTFGLLAVYRIGCIIPSPGVDPHALLEFMQAAQSTFLGFVNTFTGGSLERVAVFALGIMPYITASIILQLLTVVWPYLEKLSKEGELGRKKITQYTRYGTVVISIIQSAGIALFLRARTTPGGAPLVPDPGLGLPPDDHAHPDHRLRLRHVAGRADQRARHRQRHLADHLRRHRGRPARARWRTRCGGMQSGTLSVDQDPPAGGFMVAVVAFIVYMERAQRRIPVQYAKRVVGRRVYGGQSTYLPLRVNTGGVIPVIFASSVIMVPATVAEPDPAALAAADRRRTCSWGQPIYYLLYVAAIIFFSYFYISIIFNPDRYRGEHAQVRRLHPRHPLGQADRRVHRPHPDPDHAGRRALPGGGHRAARVPAHRLQGAGVCPGSGRLSTPPCRDWFTQGMGINFYFGGTSLLIVVGVAMDTIQQVESQLVMRNYEGFLKKGRIRGRRG